jgi:capsid protein
MGVISKIFGNKKQTDNDLKTVIDSAIAEIKESIETNKKVLAYSLSNPFHYTPIYRQVFTGEKTPGEMGAIRDYTIDFTRVRARSWQLYLESEIAQTVINPYIRWVVGNGLRCQPEPDQRILQQEGINFSNDNDFINTVESRYKLWSKSRYSDYAQMSSFNKITGEAYKHALIGGDALLIHRVIKARVNTQLIDGYHICTPYSGAFQREAINRGNKIQDGIEIAPNGEHIAYYIYDVTGEFRRVPRIGARSGRVIATLIYGNKYRINNVRGVPILIAVMETLKKLDRYKEATVGSAEERAKIAYFIEHGTTSTGENPLGAKLLQSLNMGTGEAPESKTTSAYEDAATKIAISTHKQVHNLPIDATIKSLEAKNELYFKEFFEANIHIICSTIGIPYEVAMMRFDSNYSASRAAIKDWEYSVKTARVNISEQINQPFYNLWLELEILNNKIQAPGYIESYDRDNLMAIEAYQNCRWIGESIPHIDPLKEVLAERKKLGDEFTPLTTYTAAVESLGGGDFEQNIIKLMKEKELIKKAGFEVEEKEPKEPKENGKED